MHRRGVILHAVLKVRMWDIQLGLLHLFLFTGSTPMFTSVLKPKNELFSITYFRTYIPQMGTPTFSLFTFQKPHTSGEGRERERYIFLSLSLSLSQDITAFIASLVPRECMQAIISVSAQDGSLWRLPSYCANHSATMVGWSCVIFTCLVRSWLKNNLEKVTVIYCVFRPAKGCSARRLLVEIDFLTLKQLFPSLTEQNKQKNKRKPLKIMQNMR